MQDLANTLNSKTNFYSLPMNLLLDFIAGLGKEKFRAQQLYKWVYEKRIHDPELMLNLSKDFRAELNQKLSLNDNNPYWSTTFFNKNRENLLK